MKKKKELVTDDAHGLLVEFIGFSKRQFDRIDDQLGKNYRISGLIVEQVERLAKEVRDIKTTINHTEQSVHTIQEDVDAIAKTVSKDSLTLRSHGRRLAKLETVKQ